MASAAALPAEGKHKGEAATLAARDLKSMLPVHTSYYYYLQIIRSALNAPSSLQPCLGPANLNTEWAFAYEKKDDLETAHK